MSLLFLALLVIGLGFLLLSFYRPKISKYNYSVFIVPAIILVYFSLIFFAAFLSSEFESKVSFTWLTVVVLLHVYLYVQDYLENKFNIDRFWFRILFYIISFTALVYSSFLVISFIVTGIFT